MSFILRDYHCPRCDEPFEMLVDRADQELQHCPECDLPSERIMSAPKLAGVGVTAVSVVKGGIAPPPNPYALDTTKYGTREQSWGEWKTARNEQHRQNRLAELKKKI